LNNRVWARKRLRNIRKEKKIKKKGTAGERQDRNPCKYLRERRHSPLSSIREAYEVCAGVLGHAIEDSLPQLLDVLPVNLQIETKPRRLVTTSKHLKDGRKV
jgi:hypothetical protein